MLGYRKITPTIDPANRDKLLVPSFVPFPKPRILQAPKIDSFVPLIDPIDPSRPSDSKRSSDYVLKLYKMKEELGITTPSIRRGAVFDIISYYAPKTHDSQPVPPSGCTKRPLPSFANEGTDFRIQLTTHIVPWKRDNKSHISSTEVWHALLSPRGIQGLEVPPMKVVVKFLQPSLLYLPLGSGSTNADYQARREAAGYDLLLPLQGSAIPYFFGKYIVSSFNSDLDLGLDRLSSHLLRLLLRVGS